MEPMVSSIVMGFFKLDILTDEFHDQADVA